LLFSAYVLLLCINLTVSLGLFVGYISRASFFCTLFGRLCTSYDLFGSLKQVFE